MRGQESTTGREGRWEPEREGSPDGGEFSLAIGTWEWDTGTGRLAWSDHVYTMFGLVRGEVEPDIELLLAITDPADRADLRHVIEEQRRIPRQIAYPFRIVRPDGEVRSLIVSVGAILTSGDAAPRLVGTVQDVTDSKLGDRELRTHHAVSDVLDSWGTLSEPLVALLGAIGSHLGASVAEIWIPHLDSDVVECIASWSVEDLDVSGFEAASRSFRFPAGATIAGKVWKSRAPLVVPEIAAEPNFLRRDPARHLGLRSAIAFPAAQEDDVYAAVVGFTTERVPSTPHLSASLAAIGQQLGQFFRWRASDLGIGPNVTPRERRILELTAQGLSGREIASALSIKPATVKSHFKNIFEKLGVANRAAAVAEAIRRGLIR